MRNVNVSLKRLRNLKVSIHDKLHGMQHLGLSRKNIIYHCVCFFGFLVTGEAFDTTKTINYAVSNIICSIVYGSRFEYHDPEFTSLVDRANRNVQLGASLSIRYL